MEVLRNMSGQMLLEKYVRTDAFGQMLLGLDIGGL
ncbi:hypothetical protein SLEP1_g50559 [Rubroshorea leprosula]|uniref:Uncharacterized protein n=1 Tax=Rubroshorea leprosula TaxID=152421 RepID=A0AAV5M1U7_9ROSI|nr:hypothetical protein SLEP1_g50559 [Rubroshorea leprosula]